MPGHRNNCTINRYKSIAIDRPPQRLCHRHIVKKGSVSEASPHVHNPLSARGAIIGVKEVFMSLVTQLSSHLRS
ncbi:unnamed protein product [Toxocara canis]|uniref:Uncharacterized protein n=1 Tax=Toxocara canis TaxID=6265 RepID=A0A183VDN6_TOXCA|nr:unnamed protein product [Toxocara canis]